MNLLSAENLSIGYHRPLKEEINFELKEGEVLFIEGVNGSGKSTLIKTLLHQMKALKGRVYWAERPHSYMPQVFSPSLPLSLTVNDFLSLFDIKEESYDFIPPALLKKEWNQCSGGEKQKVLILSRLNKECEVLFLDEPFNHLDQENINHLSLFLLNLMEKGLLKALIIISHMAPSLFLNKEVKRVKL